MQTICVEIYSDIPNPVIYYIRKGFKLICNRDVDIHNLILCTKEDLEQIKNSEIQSLQEEIENLKIKIEKLKNKDYKNRALKASLAHSNKIMKLLTD